MKTDKRIVYPIGVNIDFYLINQNEEIAKVTIGFGGGLFPTHEQIVAKMAEQVASLQGEGDGLHGSFRLCTREEMLNAQIMEESPVAAAAGPFVFPRLPDDQVWYADLERCGCAICEPSEAKQKDPKDARDYHNSYTGFDADGRAED